jgi:hypothetical protein
MTKRMIDLGLVQVTQKEAADCVKMLIHDARDLAGQFHGENRSEKFRESWPDEYKFARANWKSFIEATIQGYAALLGMKHVAEHDKHRMYVARLMWERLSKDDPSAEQDNRLQLHPNTQQFIGDPFENRRIARDFGKHAHRRALLMNSVMTRH